MPIARLFSYRESLRIVTAQGLALMGLVTGFCTPRQSEELIPAVTIANVPLYPPAARQAGIEGPVRLRLSTDGTRVLAITVESGQPMLVQAAKENVKTWVFKQHSPSTFVATFRYRLLPESECDMDSGTVLLRLPTEVEVSAKRVRTCDPVGSAP